ncbi:TPA: MBL fold metallo-hydrolase [Clostridium botulinum]|nr:MBL fold metallo-hydrolase [Clostridium botulinum]
MMKAGYGDCFLIKLKTNKEKSFNVLVDSGTSLSYSVYNEKIINDFLDNNTLDLIIVTHCDDDHVKGFTRLFEKLLKDNTKREKVKRVIYNSPFAVAKYFSYPYEKLKKKVINTKSADTSARSADTIQQKLFDLDLLEEQIIINDGKSNISQDGIKITFLSPSLDELREFYGKYSEDKKRIKQKGADTKGKKLNKDYEFFIDDLKSNTTTEKLTEYNRASIAFFIEEEVTENVVLMLGDSDYEIVRRKLESIPFSIDKKLKLNYLKLSHHGSICSLSKDFLDIIECNNYLVSTDGCKYGHPDKKTLARIWNYNEDAIFYFNYEERIKAIFKNEPDYKYKMKCIGQRSFYGTRY